MNFNLHGLLEPDSDAAAMLISLSQCQTGFNHMLCYCLESTQAETKGNKTKNNNQPSDNNDG